MQMISSLFLQSERHSQGCAFPPESYRCMSADSRQGGKGLLKDTPVEDMLAAALKAVLDKSGIDPKLVEDVAVGSVLSPGQSLHCIES